MNRKDLISVRGYHPDDEAFIFQTWLQGLYHGNSLFNLIDHDIYFTNYRKVIESLLKTAQVSVACLKDDPEIILGYSISQGTKLHWVHVKEAWRKIGIAKELLPPNFDTVTHVTTVGENILKNKKSDIKFNPFL